MPYAFIVYLGRPVFPFAAAQQPAGGKADERAECRCQGGLQHISQRDAGRRWGKLSIVTRRTSGISLASSFAVAWLEKNTESEIRLTPCTDRGSSLISVY
ncbi:hypothetical protein AB3466_13795 [Sphingobacterium thalpophilum]|uniref:hypothetical protein n=1 Tax=Sphingobacterium thalpophilum TaxID=259 RepID=UPI0037DA580A